MNRAKKVLAFTLAVVMLLGCMSTSVFAGGESFTYNLDFYSYDKTTHQVGNAITTAKAGDVVVLKVSLTNNTGSDFFLGQAQVELLFDTDIFSTFIDTADTGRVGPFYKAYGKGILSGTAVGSPSTGKVNMGYANGDGYPIRANDPTVDLGYVAFQVSADVETCDTAITIDSTAENKVGNDLSVLQSVDISDTAALALTEGEKAFTYNLDLYSYDKTTHQVGDAITAAKAGDVVVLKVSLTNNTGSDFFLGQAQVELLFDTDIFSTFIDTADTGRVGPFYKAYGKGILSGTAVGSPSTGKVNMGYANGDGYPIRANDPTVDLGYVAFQVAADAETCNAAFTIDKTAENKVGNDLSVLQTVNISDTAELAVSGGLPIIGTVTLDKTAVTADAVNDVTVHASAASARGTAITSAVTWSVSGKPEGAGDEDVTVAADGTVTVDAKAAAGTYTICAAAKSDASQGAAKTATLTVSRTASVATSIEVYKNGSKLSAAADTVIIPSGDTANSYVYTAKVFDQYGTEMTDAAATLTFATADSKVAYSNGTVTVSKGAVKDQTYTLTAAYTGVTDKVITLTAKDIEITAPTVTPVAATYGMTWAQIIPQTAITGGSAALNGTNVPGSFYLKTTGTPNAGKQSYEIYFKSTDEAYDVLAVSGEVTVAAKTIAGVTVEGIAAAGYEYDGSAKTPVITVKDGSAVLTKDTDYTLSYTGNTNVGTATITVTGKGNYDSATTKTVNFTITKKALTVSAGTLVIAKAYDGTTSVGAAQAGTKLGLNGVVGEDAVEAAFTGIGTYPDVNVGTGKAIQLSGITLTGAQAGNYTVGGTATVNVGKITKAAPTAAHLDVSNATKTYNGAAQQPTVACKTAFTGMGKITVNTARTNVGKEAVSVTIAEGTNFTAATLTTGLGDFEITKLAMTGAVVTLADQDMHYTGSVLTRNIASVKLGTLTLTADDYDVTGNTGTNVGDYTMTLTGKGNFSGSVTAAWKILKTAQTDALSFASGIANKTYGDAAFDVAVAGGSGTGAYSVSSGNTAVLTVAKKSGTTDTFTVTIVGAGSAKLTVNKAGDDNFADADPVESAAITVAKAALTDVSVSQKTALTYNGQAQTAAVNTAATPKCGQTVTFTYCAEQAGTYTAAVPAFTAAGDHTVYFKADAANHNTFSGSFTVTIAPCSIANAAVTLAEQDMHYTGSALTRSIASVKVGTMTLTAADYDVTGNTGTVVNSYEMTLTGKGNFTGTKTAAWTISKAAQTVSFASGIANKTYGDAAFDVVVAGGGGTGAFSVSSGNTAVLSVSQKNATTFTVTVVGAGSTKLTVNKAGDSNYEAATAVESAAITVAKADAAVTAPTAKTLTYTGSAQALVNAGSSADGTVKYCLTQSGTYSTEIPTGTNAGEYTVWYKVFGDSNHKDSAPASVKVTIAKKTIDVSGVAWDYTKAFTWDGTVKSVTVKNLPAGVTASYTGNTGTDVKADYKAAVTLTAADAANTQLTGTTPMPLTWAINKAVWNGMFEAHYYIYYGNTDPQYITVAAFDMPTGTQAFQNAKIVTTEGGVNGDNMLATSSEESFSLLSGVSAGKYARYAVVISSDNYENVYGNINVYAVDVTFKVGTETATDENIFTETAANKVYGNTWGSIVTKASGFVANVDTETSTDQSCFKLYVDGAEMNAAAIPEAGSYTVAVKFSGTIGDKNYDTPILVGSRTVTIAPADITGVGAAQTGTLTYNGAEQAASVVTSGSTVNGKSTTFTYCAAADGEYTATMPKFTDAGEHTVYYKIAAESHNTASGSFKVTIAPCSIAGAVVTLAEQDMHYTESLITRNIASVKVGTMTLANTDYNVTGNTGTNVGNYTMILTGKGNFTGTKTAAWSILKKEQAAVSFVSGVADKTYGDAAFDVVVAGGNGNGAYSVSSGNTAVLAVTQKDATTFTVTVVGAGSTKLTVTRAGDNNYEAAAAVESAAITVAQKVAALTWAGAETRSYDGTASNVTAAVSNAVTGDTVTVTVENGTEKNAGTYTASATALSNANYKLPETIAGVTKQYIINKVTLTPAVKTVGAKSYNGNTAATGTLSLTGAVNNEQPTATGTFVWTAAAVNTATVNVSGIALDSEWTANYVLSADSLTNVTAPDGVKINAKAITIINVKATDRPYAKDDKAIALVHTDGLADLIGVVAADRANVGYTLGEGTIANDGVGVRKVVTTNIVLTGTAAGNYVLTQPTDITVNIFAANTIANVAPGAAKTQDTSEMEDGDEKTVAENLGTVSGSADVLKEGGNAVVSDQSTVDSTMSEAKKASNNDVVSMLISTGKSSDDLKIVAEPYLEVEVESADLGGEKAITVDISAKVQMKATVAENSGEMNDDNTVPVGDPQPMPVNDCIVLSFKLPAGFAENGPIYVIHEHGGKNYIYLGNVQDDVLTFTSIYGLSEFTVVPSINTVATIDRSDLGLGTLYFESLEEALKEVADGETITLSKNAGSAAVSRAVSFTVVPGAYTYELTAGAGYNMAKDGDSYSFTLIPVVIGGSSSYDITVKAASAHGKVTASADSSASGKTVTLTVKPDKGYTLEIFTVTDAKDNEVKLTKVKKNTYTFMMPASDVVVTATFMEDNTMLNFFVDVPVSAYYYDAVLWAAQNEITKGVDNTHFGADASCTRAQAVTFLWRAAGSPAVTGTANPFTDVKADTYYYDAVLWAVKEGITTGTSETTFSPDATVTRAEIVTFLFRAAKGSAVTVANPFTDVKAGSYYGDAVLWAVKNGITLGTTETTFSPADNCVRGQMVTFLYRCFGEEEE